MIHDLVVGNDAESEHDLNAKGFHPALESDGWMVWALSRTEVTSTICVNTSGPLGAVPVLVCEQGEPKQRKRMCAEL